MKRRGRDLLQVLPSEPSRTAGRLLSDSRERALRDRLAARDEGALVELIDVATPWLLGITQGMLCDRDEAEDVVQEAFTIVWNRMDLVDQNHGLVPWLIRIARNRAIDRLRARRRRQARSTRLERHTPESATVVPAREPNEAAIPGWHIHESVHGALRALPDEQRDVISLAYFQGLTQAEISEHLRLPLGTVKTRLRLAFDKLRVALAPIKDWVL
jgi:RNA polymerase sigma-70 factor (ECF subfamily)